MSKVYVGLMSGTSMDGIDAVLVNFGDALVDVLATHSHPYSGSLRKALLSAAQQPVDVELDASGDLDRRVGEHFRDAALTVIDNSGIDVRAIIAIGSHGQTLRHQPNAAKPFSLQIGNAGLIAAGTGITTVANFRKADIAVGGQGAPLVPPFHRWLFHSDDHERVVANIGGIANLTHLPPEATDILGFDTGPGNGLMDAWISQQLGQPYDRDGEWAASGAVVGTLLCQLMADPYFARTPPKSTGFEYFNLRWLRQFPVDDFDPADVQATLCELSARTIATAVRNYCSDVAELFVCGGGVHNLELMRRLACNMAQTPVSSTAAAGLDPDWVEAVAFAWLAMRTMNGETGNIPNVTGAGKAVTLGELHYP